MNRLRALKAAGLILAAVVLGLMTVQGSYALWNTTATANEGTVQAADFNVSAVWANTSQQVPLNLGTLKPGVPAIQLVTVTNNVNATSAMKIAPTFVSPLTGTGTLVADGDFRNFVTVTTGVVGAGGTCQTVLQPPTIAKKSSTTLCISATLSKAAPATLAGKSISIPVSLIVSQV